MDPNKLPRDLQTTRWSVILLAGQEQGTDAEKALATLCETYWFPLYAYARRRGYSANESQDLTQEFFAALIDKNYVASADQQRGRFRAFLLTAFKNFISKQRDKSRAQKRGGGRMPLSLDLARGESRYVAEPAETLTPEQLYDREWAVDLLNRVMSRLEKEMIQAGKTAWFDQIKSFIVGGSENATYSEAADSLGASQSAVKMAVHRMRKRYAKILREEIAETLEHVADVEDEIRALFATFSA